MGESEISKKKTGTPAINALTRAGVEFEIIEYQHSEHMDGGYAKDTAQLLGISEGLVLKTLLTRVDGTPVVGLVPASTQLSLKALARAAGGKKGTMMVPSEAEKLTGYVTGGISPLGQRTSSRTFIDISVQDADTVCISGGKRSLSLLLNPQDLATVIPAVFADIASS